MAANGYMDDDWRTEPPFAIDRFLELTQDNKPDPHSFSTEADFIFAMRDWENDNKQFYDSVQFELDFGDRRIRVNCPDEDSDIYIQIKRGKQYAGLSLSLDHAEELANYILGHVNNLKKQSASRG